MNNTEPAYTPRLTAAVASYEPRESDVAASAVLWNGNYMLLLRKRDDVGDGADWLPHLQNPRLTYERPHPTITRDALVFTPEGGWVLWESLGAVCGAAIPDSLGRQRFVFVDQLRQTSPRQPYMNTALSLLLADRRDASFRPARPRFISRYISFAAGDVGRLVRTYVNWRQYPGILTGVSLWLHVGSEWTDHSVVLSGVGLSNPGLATRVKRPSLRVGRWMQAMAGFRIEDNRLIAAELPVELVDLMLEITPPIRYGDGAYGRG